MKKIKGKLKGKSRPTFRVSHVNKLIVKPLTRRIEKHNVECLKRDRDLLEKLEEIDESIGVIAREIARKARRG